LRLQPLGLRGAQHFYAGGFVLDCILQVDINNDTNTHKHLHWHRQFASTDVD